MTYHLQSLSVTRPAELRQVGTSLDYSLTPRSAWLAYPKEYQSIPQPIIVKLTDRNLIPTKPNLLEDDNVGLLFPAVSFSQDIYASRLTRALCLPHGIIITEENSVFSETFRTPKSYLAPDPHVRRLGVHLDEKTQKFSVTDAPPANAWETLSGPSFFLDGLHFGSYGHMLVEILPRLWYFLISGARVEDFHFICGRGSAASLMPFLSSFGINERQLVFNLNGIICEDLYVVGQGAIVRQSVSTAARAVWEQWRRLMTTLPALERVYISRSTASSRKLSNEAELETLLAKLNFKIVNPELLSFSEQISIFAGAKFIIGPSGSNMFNIAFARNDQRQMVITSDQYILHNEVLIRPRSPEKLTVVIGVGDIPGHVHGAWSVDLRKFEDVLREWLN